MNDPFLPKKTLLETDIENDFKAMESNLFSYSKKLNEIREYSKGLNNNNYNYYASNNEEIKEYIQDCNNIEDDINTLADGLYQYNITQFSYKQKIQDKKTQYLNKLEGLKDDLNRTCQTIRAQESKFDNPKYRGDKEITQGANPILFEDDKIQMVVEINTNKDRLAKNKQDLENIKQTSAQLNSMTHQFKAEVFRQGEVLNSIEDNIVQTKEQVSNAEDEIKEADRKAKATRKKLCWLIVIIVFVVASMAVLAYLIYTNTTPTPTPS